MRELKLNATGGFRKSAKISGDVMGNYHPHGDAAIYDAMARLAQEFNVRYPLVDGQGNFGNIDGDNPAASRYTEARMTTIAEALLDGLNEDAVDFRQNYDGTLSEPIVLPASFPNLLANGSSGIAVGMATNIPPHNISELCDACLHLIKSPDARIETLLKYIPGPDFPTGGTIVESHENILNAYKTGRGSFRLRARFSVEDLERGQWQIVITEIPFQVQKSKLIEKIAELIQTKKIPILEDIRDESAEDIRVVLEPKSKNVDPNILMETLFKISDLEIRFSMNMNVLIDGLVPKVCDLNEVLKAFLDHRRNILKRRSNFRLKKIDNRLEVLEGLIIAFLNLDRVIDIIRYDDNPKLALMSEDWGKQHDRAKDELDYKRPDISIEGELSDIQTEAILNMRLRSLRRLEEVELVKERDSLMEERANLEDLLADTSQQWNKIAEEIRETKKQFGQNYISGTRRTDFAEAQDFEEVPIEAMIEREPITVVCSSMGWIRAMNGHIDLTRELKFKDGDGPGLIFHAQTTDKLLALASNGRFYTIQASSLPGGRGMGEPLRLMVDIPDEALIVNLITFRPGQKLLVASSTGDGFIVTHDDVVAQTKSGKQILNTKREAVAKVCHNICGDHVAVVGENRKVLIFPVSEIPEMVRGKGVRLQKYKDGGLSDITTFNLSEGLTWLDPAGRTRSETNLEDWTGKRATAGRMAPRGFPKNNKFI
jgi:topoisomerase-4 subunit A